MTSKQAQLLAMAATAINGGTVTDIMQAGSKAVAERKTATRKAGITVRQVGESFVAFESRKLEARNKAINSRLSRESVLIQNLLGVAEKQYFEQLDKYAESIESGTYSISRPIFAEVFQQTLENGFPAEGIIEVYDSDGVISRHREYFAANSHDRTVRDLLTRAGYDASGYVRYLSQESVSPDVVLSGKGERLSVLVAGSKFAPTSKKQYFKSKYELYTSGMMHQRDLDYAMLPWSYSMLGGKANGRSKANSISNNWVSDSILIPNVFQFTERSDGATLHQDKLLSQKARTTKDGRQFVKRSILRMEYAKDSLIASISQIDTLYECIDGVFIVAKRKQSNSVVQDITPVINGACYLDPFGVTRPKYESVNDHKQAVVPERKQVSARPLDWTPLPASMLYRRGYADDKRIGTVSHDVEQSRLARANFNTVQSSYPTSPAPIGSIKVDSLKPTIRRTKGTLYHRRSNWSMAVVGQDNLPTAKPMLPAIEDCAVARAASY